MAPSDVRGWDVTRLEQPPSERGGRAEARREVGALPEERGVNALVLLRHLYGVKDAACPISTV